MTTEPTRETLAEFIKKAGEAAAQQPPCTSLLMSEDGQSITLLIDSKADYFGEHISGEGGDICLYRNRETEKVVGVHLPMKYRRLVASGIYGGTFISDTDEVRIEGEPSARQPAAGQEQGGDDLLSRIQQQLKHGNTSAKIAPPFQSVQSLQVLRAIQNDEVFVISRERLEEVECELRWSKHLAAENAELKARCERLYAMSTADAKRAAEYEKREKVLRQACRLAEEELAFDEGVILQDGEPRMVYEALRAIRAALAPPAQPTEETK